jgi:ABC-2 type transport system ATP-binding protein
VVTGLPAPRIGELAASASVVLHELTPRLPSLEEAFMELTADSVEYGKAEHGKTEHPIGWHGGAGLGESRAS